MDFSSRTKIIITTVYFSLVIFTEPLYRNLLDNRTLIKDIQNKFDSKAIKLFSKYITYLGSEKGLIPLCIIFLFFNPFLYFLYLTFSTISSTYLVSVLKLIYQNPRPYFLDNDIQLLVNCDVGYGNPSGHSLVSTVVYLGLWKLISKNKVFKDEKRKIINFSLLGFIIFFILCIAFSRLYGGVHSLNQIIYGILLGIGLFILYFYFFKIYNKNHEMFFLFIEENKILLNVIFILAYILIFPLYYFANDKKNKELYLNKIQNHCGADIAPSYKHFSNESFIGGSLILMLIGMFNGLLYSKKLMEKMYSTKEYIIINWHRNTFSRKIIRFLIMGIFSFPGLLFLIPSDSPNYIILIFKYNVSFLLLGFFIFGPGMYFGFKLTFDDNDPVNLKRTINFTDEEMNSEFGTDD